MNAKVLVVDDQERPRRLLASELEEAGYRVFEASDGHEGWATFRRHRPDLVLSDVVMPRKDGFELLSQIRSQSEVPVILFTAQGSVEGAVAALKAGADDFVCSEHVDVEDLVGLARSALGEDSAERSLRDLESVFVGRSAAARRVRRRMEGLAPLRTPTLVSGEPGSGRHTVIEALHALGSTAGGRLQRIDARTFERTRGLDGASAVCLDHVEHLSPEAQTYWGNRILSSPGKPRFFASSGPGLAARARDGRFDPNLAEALLAFEIDLPSLRQRRRDIPDLVAHLLGEIGRSLGRERVRISRASMQLLQSQRWPGNVAQLRIVLERSVAFTSSGPIPRELLHEMLQESGVSLSRIRRHRDATQREELIVAIEQTGGNVSRTAELLGCSRSAVYRLMGKHGIRLQNS